MRKVLSFILSICLFLSSVLLLSVSASSQMPSPDVLDGYENVCLTYLYRPQRSDYGRQTVDDLIPYVAYLDENGNMTDFFFDSYLFLPCMAYAPSGARIHADLNNPTIATDWEDYVNETFYPGHNVNALDAAFGRAKQTLGDSERKAGVFLTILYPSYSAQKFGNLGGKELNFFLQSDRKYAIKWIIDEQIRRYREAGYQNLELLGFYWLEEEIYSDYDESMMKFASEYLHSLGLKFIWIPWFQAPGYDNWEAYGFDLACLQPNDMWPDQSNPNRVKNCASLCERYGMSMQIEASHDCAESDRYNRYMKYLDVGMTSGAMDSVKFYYQDGKTGVYYASCYSEDPYFRSVYDLTYKYAKGTLTPDDIVYDDPTYAVKEEPFVIPDGVEWVSYGKSYTGCESYTDGNGMPYQEVSGNELTDGVLGSSNNGTEWHAYHISVLDDERRMSTTLDLGEVYTDLTHVMAQFLDYQPFNIGAPKDVKLYVSEDGENFELLGKASLKIDDNMYHIKYNEATPFKARYVKMSFLNAGNNFVFCSEFMVGRDTKVDENASEPIAEVDNDNEDGNNVLIYVSVGISVLLLAAVAGAVIFELRKQNKE